MDFVIELIGSDIGFGNIQGIAIDVGSNHVGTKEL